MGDTESSINSIINNQQEVVIGTKEFPIVSRNSSGDLCRITKPERPQQLPTFVFWDETLNQEQKDTVIGAMNELFSSIGLEVNKIHTFGNWKSDKYRQNDGSLTPNESIQWAIQRSFNRERGQINVSPLLTNMFFDPYQYKSPHWEVIFTNRDLYMQGTNFCIGAAQPDLGTLISLYRFPGYEKTPFGREVIKTEIFHEVGHVLGLPSTRRGINNLESTLGFHCKSDGCSMKQGMSVPDDWINVTKRRIIRNNGPYCSDCLRDLTKKK
ncbi:MAG TPA: hypothetical protein PKH06_02020 [Candidatus Dojkabacteria bacterium]|nr:hypothetical protein [Candidatus Dojkabacteria bacterium]